jgi:hypothetical protein
VLQVGKPFLVKLKTGRAQSNACAAFPAKGFLVNDTRHAAASQTLSFKFYGFAAQQ